MPAPDRTHYDVLGLSRDADANEVRTAWRKLVQVWHPDRYTDDEMRERAELRASEINEAYHALRDTGRRAAYDCRLAADELDARRAREEAARAAAPSRSARGAAARSPWAGTGATATAAPVGPLTLDEQLRQIGGDFWLAVRRHPRIVAVAVGAWVVVFGGALAMHALAGPSLPSGTATRAAAVSSIHDSSSASSPDASLAGGGDTDALDELADRAREEAAQDQRDLQQMLREDAAAQAADEAAQRKADALAAKRQPKGAADPRAGAVAAPALPPGAHIVRVMPSAAH